MNSPAGKMATERLSAFNWPEKRMPGVSRSKMLQAAMKPARPVTRETAMEREYRARSMRRFQLVRPARTGAPRPVSPPGRPCQNGSV